MMNPLIVIIIHHNEKVMNHNFLLCYQMNTNNDFIITMTITIIIIMTQHAFSVFVQ